MHPTIFALKRAYQATRTTLDRELERYDLTAPQLDALIALKRMGTLEQHALSEALGVSRATLARMLVTMEDHGYVSREPSPDDARSKTVHLEDRGAELIERLQETEEEAFTEQFFDGLSHTDVARLTRLLDRIAENMGDTSRNIYR